MTDEYQPGQAGASANGIDSLLKGAIDFHHHGYPEISFDVRTRLEDVDALRLARDAGMAGIVLKSHFWPTVGRAYLLRQLVPGIEVVGSITLNSAVGGFHPLAVESAARQGARVAFMPTWSAAHDMERGGMSRYIAGFLTRARALAPERGLRVTGADGRVEPEVLECLDVMREFGMVLCTGHISPRESLALAGAARDRGIAHVVFSHPDSHSVGASRDEIREMVALGAVCEFCVIGTLPAFQRIHPRSMVEIVDEIGPERVVLTTDYFFDWFPPAPEALRMLIGTFLQLGVPAKSIGAMVRDNPARMLGWAARATGGS
jgi:uncharacterized protein DUF6282